MIPFDLKLYQSFSIPPIVIKYPFSSAITSSSKTPEILISFCFIVFACSGKSEELDLIESFVVSVRGSSAFSSLVGDDHKSEENFKS